MADREIPRDFSAADPDASFWRNVVAPIARNPAQHRPQNEWQALMEAAPHCEPETDLESLEKLGDHLADAVDGMLSYPLRYIVEATIIERRPLSSFTFGEVFGDHHARADDSMSKAYVSKLRERALAQLREFLSDDPVVQEHLHR